MAFDPNHELNKAPCIWVTYGLLMLLLFYTILQLYFFLDEQWMTKKPYGIYVLCGLFVGFIYWLLIRKKLSDQKAVLKIAVLMGLMTAIACLPASLQLLNLYAKDTPHAYTYTLGDDWTWQSETENLPDYKIHTRTAYWKQFKPGDAMTLNIRVVGNDYFTINMQNIYDDQKAFYAKKK